MRLWNIILFTHKKFTEKCYVFVTSILTLKVVYVRIEKRLFRGEKTLDKHDYRSRIDEMLKHIKEKSYDAAFEVAESIDWTKVKNAAVISAASDVYERCGEISKSRDVLFLAYERSPESKKIVYRLGTLALKEGRLKEAVDCYDEFVALAPKDPNRFIFKYKILKAKKAPVEEQIALLEEFKKVEYVEKWAFELAKLYQEAGMISECLEECDDLVLWFSEGKYIYKAMELKMQYKPLTPLQQEKYMNRQEAIAKSQETKATVQEEPKEEGAAKEMMEEKVTDPVMIEPETEVQEEVQEVKEITEETTEEKTVGVSEDKPLSSIEQMVQSWQEEQKENAQMIQAELQRVEQEKAQNDVAAEEEEKEEILSDDVRKLMEELEAESAEIEAQKVATGEEEVEEAKPLLQKVVEQLSAFDTKPEKTIAPETAQLIEEIEEPEEGIKLGNTQSMALAAKALENAMRVEVPEIEIPVETPVVPVTPANQEEEDLSETGFIVQGRYDLEAQSEIGLQAGLTEEQKKLFSYFVPVHGMSEQLVQVLQNEANCKTRYGTSQTGNIVIVGRKGSGKTVLAVDIVKAIQKQRRMKQGKVAIVKAEALNKKNVHDIVQKLKGGALVIEKASRLHRNTIELLCGVMDGQTGEMLVVVEDERKPIDRMFAEYPDFQKKFTSRIELPVFINDELVTFGQTYAKENGYKIDDMGILALYSDIDILQREEKVVTVADVKALIDDAIENANRFTVKKFIKQLFGKNRDEADRIILKEEDFR